MKNFKQLVMEISEIESENDRRIVCGDIDKSFEHGKISWKDHEILYNLACKIA